MITVSQYVLYVVAMVSAGLSLFYSIKSKRSKETKSRGRYNARMNIAMGVMLLSFGAVQLFLHEFDSWVRVGVGFVFILIGLFNVFAGIRNHAHFNRS